MHNFNLFGVDDISHVIIICDLGFLRRAGYNSYVSAVLIIRSGGGGHG